MAWKVFRLAWYRIGIARVSDSLHAMDDTGRNIVAGVGLVLMAASLGWATFWFFAAPRPFWELVPAIVMFVVGAVLVVWMIRARSSDHQLPDGHLPWVAPPEYQAKQIRQAVAKMKEAQVSEFGLFELNAMLGSLRRKRTDRVYEPLHGVTCRPGLAELVAKGELTPTDQGWKIP